MKKLLIVFLALFTHLHHAQSITTLKVNETDNFKDDSRRATLEIKSIHTNKNGKTGLVRLNKKELVFDVINNQNQKTFGKTLRLEKKEGFVGELFFGDEIKIFTVESPSKKERVVNVYKFNLEKNQLKKNVLFNTTISKNSELIKIGNKNKRQTNFAISPDGKYLAISTDNISKNSNAYTIRVYNAQNLELIFKKPFQEHQERYYEHNDLVIDNNLNVYDLGKLFTKGKSEKKKGKANYNFVLNKITKKDIHSINIKPDDIHLQSLTAKTFDDDLYLLGFYSEKNTRLAKGACAYVVDLENFKLIKSNKLQFPLDVYNDLYGEKKGERKKDDELGSFEIDHVLKDDHGNNYIIAEKFYITTTYVGGMYGGMTVTTPHYDDIIVLKINAESNIEWGRSIFKRSTSPSYNAFIKNDKLHIILNSGKSITVKNDGRKKVSKGFLESTSLYDFEYSNEGEVSHSKIQDNKNKTNYTPYHGNYENDKFIMISEGNNPKFMILE